MVYVQITMELIQTWIRNLHITYTDVLTAFSKAQLLPDRGRGERTPLRRLLTISSGMKTIDGKGGVSSVYSKRKHIRTKIRKTLVSTLSLF